jgi:hypothetical protein
MLMKMWYLIGKAPVAPGLSQVFWRAYNQVGSPKTAPISSTSGEVAAT